MKKPDTSDISLSTKPEAPEGPRFKNSSGVYFTRQLFVELCDSERANCIYTLRPEDYEIDGKVYPSLRRLYLEEGDESEYRFAQKYFDGWTLWKRLTSASWFLEYLNPIREELQVKLMAEALEKIRAKARSGDYHANKYLFEKGLQSLNPVGRPSKAKIKQEAEKLFQEKSVFNDDIQRLKEFIS